LSPKKEKGGNTQYLKRRAISVSEEVSSIPLPRLKVNELSGLEADM
jgi:hypothetical protein